MRNFLLLAQAKIDSPSPHVAANQASVDLLLNTVFMLAGASAVIVVIIGGIRYILSEGDASQVKKAKDMITYAIVGLIVTIMAFAIVQLVIGVINK